MCLVSPNSAFSTWSMIVAGVWDAASGQNFIMMQDEREILCTAITNDGRSYAN